VDGAPTTPSVVSYDAPPSGGVVVGALAALLRASRPLHTIHDAKRLIGRAADDALVVAEATHLPYEVVPDARGGAAISVPGRDAPVSPEAVATALLRHLKEAAERSRPLHAALGFRFGSATISVPVAFGQRQRAATLAAGRAAGFRVVRLLDEPVAAAIAYGLTGADRERTVLVYDMGGGTLDVAILRLELSSRTFLVMGTSGDAHLGGEDFDRALAVRVRAPVRAAVCAAACVLRLHGCLRADDVRLAVRCACCGPCVCRRMCARRRRRRCLRTAARRRRCWWLLRPPSGA
jgi:molecular chaperone DnaK (HSP70)